MANNSTDKFKATIKAYLDKRAEQDEQFKATYAKENKSIDECCAYIIQEVQKAGICGWSNAEIFGMAVHYYDEDDIKVTETTSAVRIVNTNGHDDTPLTTAPTPQPSATKGKGKGKGSSKPTPSPKSTTPKSTTQQQPSKPNDNGKPHYSASLF